MLGIPCSLDRFRPSWAIFRHIPMNSPESYHRYSQDPASERAKPTAQGALALTLEAAYAHFGEGRLDEAAQLLRSVIDVEPHHGDALEGLAYIAVRQRDAKAAADYFDRALAQLPATSARYADAGTANQAAGRHERAVECFDEALALAPRTAARVPLLHAAAESSSELGNHERARQSLTQARDLNPGVWQSHYNLGRVLGLAGHYDEEVAAYRRAIELQPDCVVAYVNLGVALRDLRRFDEALRVFKKAVQIDPNDAGARTNRAQTNLLLGEFEHGWREYEWRWRDGGQFHSFGPNAWRGESSLKGKTLLVFNEQGFGDTLQFVRFVDPLVASGVRVVLRVQDALLPLLADYPGVAAVVGEGSELPPFDLHCALLSLPHALAAYRSPIPASTPYLQADPARRCAWQARLGSTGDARRIGIAWSGSTWHTNDRNRSIALSAWQSALECYAGRAEFVSLVKDVRAGDRDALSRLPVVEVSDGLDTFADTAALIAELDLVICVDTAVAHLAGALGKPVWILLPYTPDWRWQLERSDSPWYPSARLFRQAERGDWNSAMAQVHEALAAFLR
jgi:tetratricopeptide (TPR) repeat protein